MIDDVASLRLQDAWRECERHTHHLFHALSAIHTFAPLTGNTYANLTDQQIQDVDQFIFRFSRLQDTMGNRLFPAILQYLREPFDDRPMLDKLNRLEKLRFIDSVEQWQTVRNIRNRFAHDYPSDQDKNAAQLNLALKSVVDLYAMLTRISTKLQDEHTILEFALPLPALHPDWQNIHNTT